jgi:hypothetical protein
VKYIPEKEVSIDTVKYFMDGAWNDMSFEEFSISNPRPFIIDYPFLLLRPAKKNDKLGELTCEFYQLWDEIINK